MNSTEQKTRLVTYDFDGTLFNSPDREFGEKKYIELTGEKFPHKGWWGRVESLLPPIVPLIPDKSWFIEETINAYKEDIKCEKTSCMLMTGRPFKIRKRIFEILESQKLLFHFYVFRGQKGQFGNDTLEIKINAIDDHLANNNIKTLEIWEDRPEHADSFCKYAINSCKNAKLEEAIIHDIATGQKHKFFK